MRLSARWRRYSAPVISMPPSWVNQGLWSSRGRSKAAVVVFERQKLVLKAARAVEVLDALLDGLVESDDHGGGGAQAGDDQRTLRGEVFRTVYLNLLWAAAKVLGEDLRAAAVIQCTPRP